VAPSWVLVGWLGGAPVGAPADVIGVVAMVSSVSWPSSASNMVVFVITIIIISMSYRSQREVDLRLE
jgi:hypothetical protein